MALYHQAPYTIESDRQILDAAPLAVAHDEATADLIVAESTSRLVDDFTIVLSKSGLTGTVVIDWGDETPGTAYVATVNWGDGVDELADNISTGTYSEQHVYNRSGTYPVTVNLYPRPQGRPTIQRTGFLTV